MPPPTTAIYRKLSGRRMPLIDMADILDRHIGVAADDRLCKEAVDALRQIRKDMPNLYVRTALQHLDRDLPPCYCVRKVIAALRRWRHVSGA